LDLLFCLLLWFRGQGEAISDQSWEYFSLVQVEEAGICSQVCFKAGFYNRYTGARFNPIAARFEVYVHVFD
jgi:hypothetical protein